MSKDTIYRQAAIDALNAYEDVVDTASQVFTILGCKEAITNLPSAQPDTARRIVGKSRDGMTLWYQCDMCNEPVDAQDNFCRGCGRRLTDG
jgi:hypothetical protein